MFPLAIFWIHEFPTIGSYENSSSSYMLIQINEVYNTIQDFYLSS